MNVRGFTGIAVGALLLVAASSVVLRGAPQRNATKADLEKELQKLLHERVKTAESAVETLQAAFEAQAVTLFPFLDSVNKLAEARLAVAETPAQEIDALDKRVQLMQAIEKKIKTLYEIGTRGGEAKEYTAVQRERQSAEIALLEAKIKANR